MKFRVRLDEGIESPGGDKLTCVNAITKIAWMTMGGLHAHTLVHHILPISEYRKDGNPHFHLYVDIPTHKSVTSLKYHFKKHFNGKKGSWSIKECDDDKVDIFIQYLFNEKHGNRFTQMSSSIDTTEHKRRAKLVLEDYVDKTNETKVKQITLFAMATELAQYIRNEDLVDFHKEVRAIMLYAVSIHNKYHKPYCVFSLNKVITTAMGMCDGDQSLWRDRILDEATIRLFPERKSY